MKIRANDIDRSRPKFLKNDFAITTVSTLT